MRFSGIENITPSVDSSIFGAVLVVSFMATDARCFRVVQVLCHPCLPINGNGFILVTVALVGKRARLDFRYIEKGT